MPRIAPIHISVVRAFFHSGGRNAGTPFEIASTPVIAVQPDASACRARKRDDRDRREPSDRVLRRPPGRVGPVGRPGGGIPARARTKPITISETIIVMNRYVGAAKIRPDSLTPRRLPIAIRR